MTAKPATPAPPAQPTPGPWRNDDLLLAMRDVVRYLVESRADTADIAVALSCARAAIERAEGRGRSLTVADARQRASKAQLMAERADILGALVALYDVMDIQRPELCEAAIAHVPEMFRARCVIDRAESTKPATSEAI
jgi:hypothetical protein